MGKPKPPERFLVLKRWPDVEIYQVAGTDLFVQLNLARGDVRSAQFISRAAMERMVGQAPLPLAE